MPPILTEKEPPAFGERNQTGLSPILFISDHHRNRVPASLNNLGLPDEERARHIGYDIGIAWIADYLSDRFDAPLVHTNYSRLVIDCNRQPGSPDASPVVADGTRIPGNIDLRVMPRLTPDEQSFSSLTTPLSAPAWTRWRRTGGLRYALLYIVSPR